MIIPVWVRRPNAGLVAFRDPKKAFAVWSYDYKRLVLIKLFGFQVTLRQHKVSRGIGAQLSNLVGVICTYVTRHAVF
jgi:hypothetical protein